MKGADVKHDNKGGAMIVVMCVICVFMFISFALLLATSVLVSTTQQASLDDRCRISAVTFSDAVRRELTAEYVTEGVENTELRSYLRTNIGGMGGIPGTGAWTYYEDGNPDHTKAAAYRTLIFELGEKENDAGKISGEMYWEYDSGSGGVLLCMTVTCEYLGRTQKITTQFELLRSEVQTGNKETYEKWIWKEVWTS